MSGRKHRQALRTAQYRRAMARQYTLSAATYVAGCGAIAALAIGILWSLTMFWGAIL